MIRSITYLFAFTLVLGLAAPSLAQEQKPSPKAPAPSDWKEFKSAEGGFSVSMPGDPQTESEPMDTDAGRVEIHSFFIDSDLGTYYVSYTVFPKFSEEPSAVKAILDAGRDEQVSKGARLLNDNEVTLPGGVVGREWLVESEGFILRNRTFFIKGRLYQVLFVTTPEVAFKTGKASPNPKDRTELYEEIASRFQGSFKLIEEAGRGGEVDVLLRSLVGKETVLGACEPDHPTCGSANSDRVLNGRALSLPKPGYPAIARGARVEGTVAVQVVISEEGNVIAAQVRSGHPLLFATTIEAARRATFSPTLLDGKPVKVAGVITYAFVAQ